MTFKKIVAWLEMFAVAASAVFVIMLFAGGSSDGGSGGLSADAGGAEIFAATCQRCHGAEGEGGIGPKLAGEVVDLYPDVADEIAVVEGGKGTMPSFGGKLTPQQIKRVVEFTRTDLGG